MAITPEGSIFYQDHYGAVYECEWKTVSLESGTVLDITSIVKTPYVWNRPITGYIDNKIVVRHGICSVHRQILAYIDDGYEIISEGKASYECDVPITFKCDDCPKDTFRYHLDQAVTDSFQAAVTSGSAFTDGDADLYFDDVWFS